MRVSVLINPKAGSVNASLLEEKIREALFRCDLQIHQSTSSQSMETFIIDEVTKKTDHLMVCGGDGTVNATLQVLMKIKSSGHQLPPLCVVRSGTANDLAYEIGISQRIDEAARLILEGKEKKIDVIEISAEGESKYMLTNGGIGIPALTADKANKLRALLQNLAASKEIHPLMRLASSLSYRVVKKLGSAVYSAMLLDTLREWKQKGWNLEVQLPDQKLKTQAPFVLINNQPSLGKSFVTAPFTTNYDGHVNLLMIESVGKLGQLDKVLQVYQGRLKDGPKVKSYEVPAFSIKVRKGRKLAFFGDGEILFRDVQELNVQVRKQELSVMVKDETL